MIFFFSSSPVPVLIFWFLSINATAAQWKEKTQSGVCQSRSSSVMQFLWEGWLRSVPTQPLRSCRRYHIVSVWLLLENESKGTFFFMYVNMHSTLVVNWLSYSVELSAFHFVLRVQRLQMLMWLVLPLIQYRQTVPAGCWFDLSLHLIALCYLFHWAFSLLGSQKHVNQMCSPLSG